MRSDRALDAVPTHQEGLVELRVARRQVAQEPGMRQDGGQGGASRRVRLQQLPQQLPRLERHLSGFGVRFRARVVSRRVWIGVGIGLGLGLGQGWGESEGEGQRPQYTTGAGAAARVGGRLKVSDMIGNC